MAIGSVAIVGAGPAGAATALALLKAGAGSVHLLHKSIQQELRIGETLAPNARYLLKELGLFTDFERNEQRVCRGTYAKWFNQSARYNDYSARLMGNGWHINRSDFDDWLRRQARAAGAAMTGIVGLAGLTLENNRWQLHAVKEGGKKLTLEANYIVDASGRRAVVASRLGARKITSDNLIALAVRLPACSVSPFCAPHYSLVETVDSGWWYAARVPGDQCLISLQVDAEVARRHDLHKPANWCALYGETEIMPRLLEAEIIGNVRPFAAHSQWISQVAGDRWLAVGDAAITMDPLSSSGMVCALDDALVAANTIREHAAKFDPLEQAATFRNYQCRLDKCLAVYQRERNQFYAQMNTGQGFRESGWA
jgi:flavin-dependent dehydrogenase